jgi:hypothetical protein
MNTHDHSAELVPVLLDGSWISPTRERVAMEFDCMVCLDFGHLDGIGPCPACDPDGYAEHVLELASGIRFGLDGEDPWADKAVGS